MSVKKDPELLLANDHANIALSSLVYDPAENDLLLAAFTVATSIELLAAIKAQLERHGRNLLRVYGLAVQKIFHLPGTDYGYITL